MALYFSAEELEYTSIGEGYTVNGETGKVYIVKTKDLLEIDRIKGERKRIPVVLRTNGNAHYIYCWGHLSKRLTNL